VTTEDGDRKTVPLEHRRAVQRAMKRLQKQLAAQDLPSSQAAIGQLIGKGYSQAAISKIISVAEVGEELFQDFLKFKKMTIEQLMAETDEGPAIDVETELSSPEAKKLEKHFRPRAEQNYPGLVMPALRGLRARPQLRGFDLLTVWEALADARFEQRGREVTSLDLINHVQNRLLDVGDPIN